MNQRERENGSESTTSSPRSHMLSIDRDLSQISQSSKRNDNERDLTPPSSIASSQEIYEIPTAAKKRTADGEIKEKGHSRNLSTLSQASTGSLAELSESLKTKLSYAMVKVQKGWQNHSLQEVESLASSSSHQMNGLSKLISEFAPVSKGLAPPATIVPGPRKRLAPNSHLQVNTARPHVQQRTPSQNAAMEADAVETLLFMSASPVNSASPRRLHTSPRYSRPRVENKTDFIDRVLEDLDADGHEDLDQALSILDAHKATKLAA